MRRKTLICASFLALVGCKGLDAQYVRADRQTYKVISADYVELIDKAGVDGDAKVRRLRLLESWDKRISEAEAALK